MLNQRGRWIGSAGALACLVGSLVPSTAMVSAAPSGAPVVRTCSSTSQTPQPLTVMVDGQPATGLYVLPAGPPRGIVAVGHGHTADAQTVASTVEQIATDDDVVALAMNYRGTNLSTLFGWRVMEGAMDTIAATQFFDRSCPGSSGFTNAVVGLSMGGNMSGLAVSSYATRLDGAPLYDYWVDVSGVTNVAEIYADAQAISLVSVHSVSSVGTTAMAEMQQEFGGTPLSRPLTYLAESPVLRTGAMRASGIRGVIVAHGVLDGEVTSDMSDQIVAALASTGIPVELLTSVLRNPGTPSGQTIDGYLSAFVPGYTSPFAGHLSDVVLQSALEALQSVYEGGFPPNGSSVTLSDGRLGVAPLVTVPRLPLP